MSTKTLLPTRSNCVQCNCALSENVYAYSMSAHGEPLCYNHQMQLQSIPSTDKVIRLYLALKSRGVPAQIEKCDGYKTIGIVKARLSIEVDGILNQNNSGADLKRRYYSMHKGFITVRIPNALVESNVEEATDLIVGIMQESNSRRGKRMCG